MIATKVTARNATVLLIPVVEDVESRVKASKPTAAHRIRSMAIPTTKFDCLAIVFSHERIIENY